MKNRSAIKFFAAFAALLVFAAYAVPRAGGAYAATAYTTDYVDSEMNYTETLEDIANPDRGFYKPYTVTLTQQGGSGAPSASTLTSRRETGATSGNLSAKITVAHLLISLNAFSENAYTASGNASDAPKGSSVPLTQSALSYLSGALDNVRSAGITAMLRFSYNISGWGINNKNIITTGDKISPADGGVNYIEAEPNLELILTHISQMQTLFRDNADVIMCIETGFVGPWGEMHSTSMAKRPSSVSAIMNALLDALPDSRSILVRNPEIYLNWYNLKYDSAAQEQYNASDSYTPYVINGKYVFGQKQGYLSLADNPPLAGTAAARIGMYNDAYLSGSEDMGTFTNNTNYPWTQTPRAEVINDWLSKADSFYGGELICDPNAVNNPDSLNFTSIEYAAFEAFLTGTTHVNFDYDRKSLNYWYSRPYATAPLGNFTRNFTGGAGQSANSDELYISAEANAFTYFSNHLGYRLILRESAIKAPETADDSLGIRFSLENVGFGNLVNTKNAQLILHGQDGNTVRAELPVDINLAKRGMGNVEFECQVPLAGLGLNYGEIYNAYIRIYDVEEKTPDSPLRTVRFANEGAGWHENFGANKLGDFVYSADSALAVFKNYDGTLLGSQAVQKGVDFEYGGSIPVKPAGEYPYLFAGWNKPLNITDSTVFTAIFTENKPLHSVHFCTDSGELLYSVQVADKDKLLPAQLADKADYYDIESARCRIIGWSTELEGAAVNIYNLTISGETNFYAVVQLEALPKPWFTVTFDLAGGQSPDALIQTVEQGGEAAAPAAPVKEGYLFKGWNTDAYKDVQSHLTVTAVWQKQSGNIGASACGGRSAANTIVYTAVFCAGAYMACSRLKKNKMH